MGATAHRLAHGLARIDIARRVAPRGSPRVQSLVDSRDGIAARSDAQSGFVGRPKADGGNDATAPRATPDPLRIVDMRVRREADALVDVVGDA